MVLVPFNDFNSNSSIWFSHSLLFIYASGVFSHFFVVVVVVVVAVLAVPLDVLPFSVAFHHSSIGGPSEFLTFVQLFSGGPPLLVTEIFVIS